MRLILGFKKTQPHGFTMLELIIALGIITLLTTIVAVSFSTFQGTTALTTEVEELTSVLRRAQLWALTGQTRAGQRPTGGWGVHFATCAAGTCTYQLFADTGSGDRIYSPGLDELVMDNNVSGLISIASLTPETPLDIVFAIPDGSVYFNASQTSDLANVVLEQPSRSAQVTIVVDRITGRVDVAY